MINIKELSIGNWVYAQRMTKKPVQIEGIIEKEGYGSKGYTFTLRTQDNDLIVRERRQFIEPIPITPEILEKNGFSNDFYVDEAIADYHSVRLEGYSLHIKELQQGGDDALVTYCNGSVNIATELHGEINKEIHFVHQLQNALILCGIDKEIKL